VAEATGVTINTVRAVYQRLNQEGLIDSRQGSGTFVATRPPSLSGVAMIAASAAQEARETGVDRREVAAAIYVAADAQSQAGDVDARRRRRLREQIATLERTLVDIEAKHPGVAPPARKTRRGIGPVLLDTAELERARTAMVRRLASVQAAIDRLEAEASPKQQSQPASARKGTARGRRSVRPAPAGA
jgi:DNA-binding transcriptional MocR family regulator